MTALICEKCGQWVGTGYMGNSNWENHKCTDESIKSFEDELHKKEIVDFVSNLLIQQEEELRRIQQILLTGKKVILDLCGGTGAWSLPYKEDWIKEIEGMKKEDREFDPDRLCERKDLSHTYSNKLGQLWGWNRALDAVISKLKGKSE